MQAGVEILALPRKGMGPMEVQLEPIVTGLREPVRFKWYFGDGEESNAGIPPPHEYLAGVYSVMLEVVDASGRRYTASVGIDAAAPG